MTLRRILVDSRTREVKDKWKRNGDEKMLLDCTIIIVGFVGCWVFVGASFLALNAFEGIFSTLYVIAKKMGL